MALVNGGFDPGVPRATGTNFSPSAVNGAWAGGQGGGITSQDIINGVGRATAPANTIATPDTPRRRPGATPTGTDVLAGPGSAVPSTPAPVGTQLGNAIPGLGTTQTNGNSFPGFAYTPQNQYTVPGQTATFSQGLVDQAAAGNGGVVPGWVLNEMQNPGVTQKMGQTAPDWRTIGGNFDSDTALAMTYINSPQALQIILGNPSHPLYGKVIQLLEGQRINQNVAPWLQERERQSMGMVNPAAIGQALVAAMGGGAAPGGSDGGQVTGGGDPGGDAPLTPEEEIRSRESMTKFQLAMKNGMTPEQYVLANSGPNHTPLGGSIDPNGNFIPPGDPGIEGQPLRGGRGMMDDPIARQIMQLQEKENQWMQQNRPENLRASANGSLAPGQGEALTAWVQANSPYRSKINQLNQGYRPNDPGVEGQPVIPNDYEAWRSGVDNLNKLSAANNYSSTGPGLTTPPARPKVENFGDPGVEGQPLIPGGKQLLGGEGTVAPQVETYADALKRKQGLIGEPGKPNFQALLQDPAKITRLMQLIKQLQAGG